MRFLVVPNNSINVYTVDTSARSIATIVVQSPKYDILDGRPSSDRSECGMIASTISDSRGGTLAIRRSLSGSGS
jgi:hypothetical protein